MKPVGLAPGRILGRYELLMPIAKGGMAEVWAARLHGSRGFQRLVAIKTIASGVMDDARMEQMFLEEASLAARIQHPNVAMTLDLGEHDGTLYMVMEWVDGEPLTVILSQAQQRKPLPLEIAVNLIGQACEGLHAAHELCDDYGLPLGIVHRDISPHNVLVTHSGTVKLVDFGIAKATNVVTSRTSSGELKGKFAYMAPEQLRGEAIDRRTDIFAIGVVLYLLTTGRHPYKGQTTAHTIRQLCSQQPVAGPSAWITHYPRPLEDVVLRALNKDKTRRFVDARELFENLASALPQAFQPGFKANVSEYLEELLGNGASESRTRLRLAQQALDSKRAPTPAGGTPKQDPGSVGSIRALSIDAGAASASVGAPSETFGTPPSSRATEPQRSTRPRIGSRFKWLVAAAGALLSTTLIAIGVSQLNANHVSLQATIPAERAAPAKEPPRPTPAQPTPAPASEAQAPTGGNAAAAERQLPGAPPAVEAMRKSRRSSGGNANAGRKLQAPPPRASAVATPPTTAGVASAAPTAVPRDPLERRR